MFVVPMSRDSRHLSRHLSRLFDGGFDRALGAARAEVAAPRHPALDVAETERSYVVQLDMPGVVKDDVKVSVEGRRVTVQAEAVRPADKKDGEQLVYRERAAPSYARSFTLPLELDPTETTARLEQGVLTLMLPKRDARSAAKIVVN